MHCLFLLLLFVNQETSNSLVQSNNTGYKDSIPCGNFHTHVEKEHILYM